MKKGAIRAASHFSRLVRNRLSLVTDICVYRQSQRTNVYSHAGLAQSCRGLDRRGTLRSVRHQPQHLDPGAAGVSGGGLEAVLYDKRQQCRRQALAGRQAAHLVAFACTPAPSGHDHWTVRLLAGKAIELGFVESISPETIRQLLKKTNSSPSNTSNGAFRV